MRWRSLAAAAVITLLWIILCGGASQPTLSKAADAIVRPILSEYMAAHAESIPDRSPHMRTCEQDVDQLLRTKSAAANEAIAGLMCFYIGDDARDGLKCEAINRGRKIVPYLKK